MKIPFFISPAVVLCFAPLAQAVTFTVTNSNDSGAGSLRQAIIDANATVAADTINFNTAAHFSIPRTITLTSGQLSITAPLTLDAPSASGSQVTVSANNNSRVFRITPTAAATITLRNLIITQGRAIGSGIYDSDGYGAGINVTGNFATFILENSTVSQCVADGHGGGINFNSVAATFSTCKLIQNTAGGSGGGIKHGIGSITMLDCTVGSNISNGPDGGGGLSISGDTCTISSSTISQNQADGYAGGLAANSDAVVDIVNSTISSNTSLFQVGGISTIYDAQLTLTNCTVTANTANQYGGILGGSSSAIRLANTIVAGNTVTAGAPQPDVSGDFTTLGGNLIGVEDTVGFFTDGYLKDQVGTLAAPLSPLLGPLANNGGPTSTHALLAGSPAIEAGKNSLVTAPPFTASFLDQLGQPRTIGSFVDIGAFEFPTLEVLNTNDSGTGSLRDIIALANSTGGGTVGFKNSVFNSTAQTITLTSGQIAISQSITLQAPNVGLILSGNNSSRIFNITSGADVILKRVSFLDGNSTAEGGAVRVSGAASSLVATNCSFTSCEAVGGGGLYVENGLATLSDCYFISNTATSGGGGAIKLFLTATLKLTNTTVASNTTTFHGGGLYAESGDATLINTTFIDNTADSDTNNTGNGGGIFRTAGDVSLGNTIVAKNFDLSGGTSHPDFSGSFTTLGHNRIGISTGGSGLSSSANNDQLGSVATPLDPLLTSQAFGTYYTSQASSPARDTGNNALLNNAAWPAPPERDQRGQFRIVFGTVDIGAAEAPSGNVVLLSVSKLKGSEFAANPAKFRFRRSLTNGSLACTFFNSVLRRSVTVFEFAP